MNFWERFYFMGTVNRNGVPLIIVIWLLYFIGVVCVVGWYVCVVWGINEWLVVGVQ